MCWSVGGLWCGLWIVLLIMSRHAEYQHLHQSSSQLNAVALITLVPIIIVLTISTLDTNT